MTRSLPNRVAKRFLKTFFGWHRAERYAELERIVSAIQARTILEIGTHRGSNALRMIHSAAKHHPLSQIEYFGFDLFEWIDQAKIAAEVSKQPPPLAEVQARLEASGATIRLFQGDTIRTLPSAISELPPIDFAFIDGGHSIQTIASDWSAVAERVHPGSVVVFDDYWPTNLAAGAKSLIDGLDRERWSVRLCDPIDRYLAEEGGVLEIRLAEVRPK